MKLIKATPKLIFGLILIAGSVIVGLMIPLTLKAIVDGGSNFNMTNGLQLLGLFILQAALMGLGSFLVSTNGEGIIRDLRIRLNQHLVYLPQTYFDKENSGDIVSRLMNDSQQIRTFVTKSFPNLVMGVLTIVLSLIALIKLDWKMTLAMVIIFPVMLLLTLPISKFAFQFSQKLQESLGKLTNQLVRTYGNIAYIKKLTAEDEIIEDFEEESKKSYDMAVKTNLVEAFSQPIGISVLFCAITLIFAYGGYRVSQGEITVGTLMSFLVFTLQLLNPLGGFFAQVSDYSRMKGALTKIGEILDQVPEDQAQGRAYQAGTIEWQGVHFAYQDQPIIQGIDLKVDPGQHLAVVGPSGSGKSTLAKLLLRLYPLNQGQIMIGGQDLAQIQLADLRRKIAYVSQESFTIAETIRENLCFGLVREVSDQELMEVLTKVGFTKDLQRMIQGLDSPVGENGALLSGGQKQRLAIAQALLREASVIIFDEATANLDADNETLVMDVIRQLSKDKIVMIIAHRLSTVVNADQIIFLEEGQISGQGNHQALYASHEAYHRYVDEQMIPQGE